MPEPTHPRFPQRLVNRSPATGGPSGRSALHRRAHARRPAHRANPDAAVGGNMAAHHDGGAARHRPMAAACMSTLLGAAIAMSIVGLIARFDPVLVDLGGVHGPVLVGALTALAIGVRIPQRFAMWLCALAWERYLSRSITWEISTLAISRGPVDRPLHWVALSVVALLSGIATALLPFNVRFASSAYGWMHAHFLWSATPLVVLHAVIAFAAALVPLALLGLAVSCTHHLSCRFGQWDPKATAWLLMGAAMGTWIAASITTLTGEVNLVLMTAALPVLLASLFSAALTTSRSTDVDAGPDTTSSPLPIWVDRWPTLLRASIVAVAVSATCAACVWNGYLAGIAGQAEMVPVPMLLALGAGAWVGSKPSGSLSGAE